MRCTLIAAPGLVERAPSLARCIGRWHRLFQQPLHQFLVQMQDGRHIRSCDIISAFKLVNEGSESMSIVAKSNFAIRNKISCVLVIATMQAGAANGASLYVYTTAGGGEVRGSTGPISTSGSGTTFYGDSYSGFATAGFGLHKVNASTASKIDPVSVQSRSEWIDSFRVQTPNSGGTVAIGLDISSDLYREGGRYSYSNASFSYSITGAGESFSVNSSIDGGVATSSSFDKWTQDIRDNGNVLSRFVTIYVPFSAGVGFTLRSSASCTSGGRGAGSLTLPAIKQECDAGNSVYWGGILGVFDSAGAPVADWSVTSDSGTDYSRSFVPMQPGVPEPSAWAMMITGFGLLGAQMRRRRQLPILQPA